MGLLARIVIQSPGNVCANKSTLVVLAPNAKGVLATLLLVAAGAAVIPWDLNRKDATRIRVNAIVILASLESLVTNACLCTMGMEAKFQLPPAQAAKVINH